MTSFKFVKTTEPLPDTTGMSKAEEQKAWAAAAQNGCDRALALLLDSVGALIHFEAKRWTYGALGHAGTAEFIEDVVAECRLWLFRKLESYDPELGSFVTFAGYQIKGACSNYVRNNAHTVHIPGKFDEMCQRVQHATNEFVASYNRQPTNDELATRTGLTLTNLQSVHQYRLDRITSLDEPLSANTSHTKLELLTYEPHVDDTEDELMTLREFVRKLPDRQRYVIEHRFGLVLGKPKTLLAIGVEFGVSRERVRQIELAALKALRELASGYSSETRRPVRNVRAHNQWRKAAVG